MFYRTAWRLKYKLLKAMAERESARVLIGKVVADDAVGGGKRERGTEGKADLPWLVERLLHASVRRPPRPEKWLRLGFRYFNPIQRFFDPYKRIRAIADKVEVEIDLPGLAIVPLKTVARWQPRLN